MDEYKRQVFERARAMLDRTDQNAFEHELWLESHRDPITGQIDLGEVETRPEPTRQHRAGAELIYKTYQPTQQPQQQAGTWDAATEARWNSWCDSAS